MTRDALRLAMKRLGLLTREGPFPLSNGGLQFHYRAAK
jgi:hypothetical protein